MDFGRSVANRLILVSSNRASSAPEDAISATPCGGSDAPGGSTCAIDEDDVNHVLVRKTPSGLPFYLAVF